MAEAKVSVRSDLMKIAEDLKAISGAAQSTGDSLNQATKSVAAGVNDQLSIVSGGMRKIRQFGQDLAKQLGSDFKGLFSVNALASGLKLNEQFAGSIKQAVELNDTIRNLAPVFGMTEERAERFKKTLVKGLSEIGIGSDAAAAALQGLAETNVRGDEALSAYAKTASELAGISKQKGQEGAISKGLAGVVVAEGGNANDTKAMQKVADDVIRIRNATGKSATEALQTLQDLFANANSDLKKKLTGGGAVSLSMASLIGGQGSTDFLKRYLGMDKYQRTGLEAQGIGKLIGSNGQLNVGAFQQTIQTAKYRGSGNAEAGLKTMGLSDDEAKGFLRLADALKENGSAIERARTSVIDINDEYRKTMSFGDAFRANLNRVKGGLAGLIDNLGIHDPINKATNALSDASKSTAGSAAVVGGGAILSAVLLGGGLKGIGNLFGLGGEAKKAAIEGLTGEKVQRVEVINWPTSLAGAYSVLGDAAKTAGGAAGAGEAVVAGGAALMGALPIIAAAATAAAAIYGGKKLEDAYESAGNDKKNHPVIAAIKEANQSAFDAIYKKLNFAPAPIELTRRHDVRVMVDTKDKSLKAYPRSSRGPSQ